MPPNHSKWPTRHYFKMFPSTRAFIWVWGCHGDSQAVTSVKTEKLGPCGPQTLIFLGLCKRGVLAIVAPPCGNHSPTRCQFDVKFNDKPRGWHPFPLILNPKQVILLFHDQPLGLQLFGVPLNVAITFYGLRMGLQGPSNLKSP